MDIILAALCFLFFAQTAKADMGVWQMPPAASLCGDELLYCNQGGVDKQCTADNFCAHISNSVPSLAAPVTQLTSPYGFLTAARGRPFMGLSTNVQGSGNPGFDNMQKTFWFHASPTTLSSNPGDTLRVDRYAEYKGGDAKAVFAGVHGLCYAGANVTDIEWCGLFSQQNYATNGGGTTALYAQEWAYAGANPSLGDGC